MLLLVLFGLDIVPIFNYLEEKIFMVLKLKIIFLLKDCFALVREIKNLPEADPSNLSTQLQVQH